MSFFLSPASFFSHTMQTLPSDHLDHIGHNTSKRGQGGGEMYSLSDNIWSLLQSSSQDHMSRIDWAIDRENYDRFFLFYDFSTTPPLDCHLDQGLKDALSPSPVLGTSHPISRNCQLPLMQKSLLFSCKQQLISRVSPLWQQGRFEKVYFKQIVDYIHSWQQIDI